MDFSQLQPQSVNVDTGFFQQQLPSTINQQMNGGLGPFTPNNPAFNGQMGPFQTAPTGSINPLTGQLNTDFRAFGNDFIPRGPGDTPDQQSINLRNQNTNIPLNRFALGGF